MNLSELENHPVYLTENQVRYFDPVEVLRHLTQNNQNPIGGLKAMIGVKRFIVDGKDEHGQVKMLCFKFPNRGKEYNYCRITLGANDEYCMALARTTSMKRFEKTGEAFWPNWFVETDIPDHALKSIFETRTGLFTRLF